jgi:hypothetical protein
VVELFAQFSLVDDLGETHSRRAVLDAEGDLDVPVTAKDRLRHQELVEVRIEHGPHDRVDLPGVVVDPGGDVHHR